MSVPTQNDIEEKDFHCNLIRENWTMLAAMAYQGYLKDGRGMVAIKVHPTSSRERAAFDAYYFPRNSTALLEWMDGSDNNVDKLLTTYQPENEALFIVPHSDGTMSIHRMRERLSPKDAVVKQSLLR